jgi:hypothetical protein
MPADPITPSLATAWSNTAPSEASGIPRRLYAFVRQATNFAIPGSGGLGVVPTFDGVSIEGHESTAPERLLLLTNQSTPSQNGIYRPTADVTGPTMSGTFAAGTGLFTKTGLVVGRLYQWTKASNETSCTNGTVTLTESGFIQATAGGNLTFLGQPSTAVSSQLWQTFLTRDASFNSPEEAAAGTLVTVTGGSSGVSVWRLRNDVVTFGATVVAFDQVTADGITPGGAAAWDNTAPGSATPGTAAAFDNTAPGSATPSLSTAWSNTAPQANVLPGETSPVAGVTSPGALTAVAHGTTLVAGTNYFVQVGSRSAPVNIMLPDPGALGQRIDVADISGQAATWVININSGTKLISDIGDNEYVLNRNNAVLSLSYTGTAWKIV